MHTSLGIALCCSTHSLGGIELNILRLARWLRERGHRCLVVAAQDSPLQRHAGEAGLPVHSLVTRNRYRVFADARLLARRFADEGIGNLILNVNRDLLLGVLAKRRSDGLRLLHMQHMQFGAGKRDPIHRWQHAQLDAWIAPLPSLAAQTARMTTIPPDRIHVIPLGVDLTPFHRLPDRGEARVRLGLPRDAFIAGVLGRLDRGKGQEYLLRATAQLRARGLDIYILIVGEETRGESQGYAGWLHRLAAELRIADHVHFRGFTDDTPSAYAAMDVFALTSLSETYGMVTIEALAAGLPVVATAAGGTPELVGDTETAMLVPAADASALADALARIHADPTLARRLAERGRTRAFEGFSHVRQCEALERLLHSLEGSPARARHPGRASAPDVSGTEQIPSA